MAERDPVSRTSQYIYSAFDKYLTEFNRLTARARTRFERRNWKMGQRDAMTRLDLYERFLTKAEGDIRLILGRSLNSIKTWNYIKSDFEKLAAGRGDIDMAETFYNSVTRKIFSTVGLNREIEFFSLKSHRLSRDIAPVVVRYENRESTADTLRQILEDHAFKVGYEDITRDCELAAREIDLHLWPILRDDGPCRFDIIRPVFFRNKAAYIIGRIIAGPKIIPLALPMYNGPRGIYVDTVLLSEPELSIVFGFAYSYFQVEIIDHGAMISFLKSILPEKPLAELYSCIGYARHSKTEFYRDLHRFVHESHERFVEAPGKEGAVMIVFTLPDYNYVFKVIKDHPCFLRSNDMTSKTISAEEVRNQYDMVRHRDRVGRLVDTQEFENLRFRKKRFSKKILNEFEQAARCTVEIDDEYVVIRHLYVQRKVVPMPLYLYREKSTDAIKRTIIDFGYFLKDLAASGIFPSDLFNTWNYGITRRGRVVLYDYDDVMPLEKINFLVKPIPRDSDEEMEPEENRIKGSPDDYFMDEINRYIGIPQPLRGIFLAEHNDLLIVNYWLDMKRRVESGEVIDITPYDHGKRFGKIAQT